MAVLFSAVADRRQIIRIIKYKGGPLTSRGLHAPPHPNGITIARCLYAKTRLLRQYQAMRVRRNKGIAVLMSARCHNQTSSHNLRRLLREGLVPHSPNILPQIRGKFSEAPWTAQPWLPSGKIPQRLTIGSTPCRPKMRSPIAAMRTALFEYNLSPSERNLQILRAARNKAQQTARRCANEYCTQLNQDIQTSTITGNIR